ncbi:hypothetical protein V8V91_22745 [Algoriphagus halophilus]|uniref:hypothetical protein n=1 Tax=Algoriphagus halophilus TaxID=226505 RepID=UPI00358FADDF
MSQAFSQDDQLVAASSFSEDEVIPNYHYEYIPDFTYDEVADRISNMDTEMPFELNDKFFHSSNISLLEIEITPVWSWPERICFLTCLMRHLKNMKCHPKSNTSQ